MQVEIAENRDMCNWVQSVLVFHPPFKRTVMGSNPVAPTNNINDLATPRGGFFMSQRRLQRQIEFFQIVTVRLLADAIPLRVLFLKTGTHFYAPVICPNFYLSPEA